jgi:O-antigen/teichoic acid export membrane protein
MRLTRPGDLKAMLDRPETYSVAAGLAMQTTLIVSGIAVARMLGPTDRGYFALLSLLPVVLWQLGSLGLPVATTYFVATRAYSVGEIVGRVRPHAAFQALALVPLHALLLVTLLRGDPDNVLTAGCLTLLMVPACLAQQYGIAVLQGQLLFVPFNVLRVLPLLLYSAAALGLLLLNVESLPAVCAAWTLSYLASGLSALAVARRSLRRRAPRSDRPGQLCQAPDRNLVRRMYRFGLRGLLGSSSPIETFRLDQALVGLVLTPAALGIYVVALALTNVPRFVAQSIGMVAFPQIASQADSGNDLRSIWRFLGVTLVLAAAVVVVLEACAPALVRIFFGSAFVDAVPVVRILLIGSLCFAGRRVLTDAARGAGHAFAGSLAELCSWAVLIPLLLILPSDVQGVAAALTISSAVSFAALAAIVLLLGRVRQDGAAAVAVGPGPSAVMRRS